MGEIKVVFSSINLAQSPYSLRSPEWLGEFSLGAHCDGVEYMPQYDLLFGHTPRAIGRAVMSGALRLNSLHATFREGSHPSNTNKFEGHESAKARLIRSPLGRLILPEVSESANVMAAIQHHAGVNVPAVLYPQRRISHDRWQISAAQAREHLFQPTDHVAKLVMASTLEKFDRVMRISRGYGYVLDTFHARRRYGAEENGLISDTELSVPYMAPNTRALHLSFGRTDIGGEEHIPTVEEAWEAARGEYTGELREMLDVVKDAGNVEYAVIELTTQGIAQANGYTNIDDQKRVYADIADGFREYWGAT